MLQLASYVGGFAAIKVEVSVRHIGVMTGGITIEHAQGNKCIEEVARAAFMDASAFARNLEIEWSVSEHGKESKFDRAQQRLCRTKCVAQLEYSIRSHATCFHNTPD
jgi:hypothetical protein